MKKDLSVSYRLGSNFHAAHYDIALRASPKRRGFAGTVTLTGHLDQPSPTLVLHGRGLKVTDAQLLAGRKKRGAKVSYLAANEQVVLQFAEPVPQGPLKLTLAYTGKLAQSMHGLYLAKDGPEVALVSQCEASDARAIFPCLDEPSFKASLQWTVTTDAGLTVITNGRSLGHKAAPGNAKEVVHRFAKTAPMSTYLAAVTVGHFEPGASKKVGPTPCRILAGKNKAAQTEFALEVTQKVLPYYVNYFGEPYAYDKLDQVAVPGFDAGAMENSGAIFYRQSLLLMARGQTSFAAQKRIGEVIAHEIAHQWFGNLVTMAWWDDLWLNEAFATWIAFRSCNALYPKWKIWHDYLEAKESALVADALSSTHPIYAEVKTPAEATELFDVITYEKGCGVLRMAEGYLGEDAFRSGIRRYIRAHKFKNARGMDLWNALGQAAKQPVADLMQSWVTQDGFPLITCRSKGSAGERKLVLEQQRFTGAPGTSLTDHTWMVPLVIAYDVGDGPREHRVLLDQKRLEVVLPGRPGQKLLWAYPNHEATGFWRCRLSGALQAAVLAAGPKALGTAASMAVVYDAWALLRAGHLSVDEAMATFEAFGSCEDPAVFRAIAGRLRALDAGVVQAADRKRLANFAAELARPHLDRLGWTPKKGESPHDAILRTTAVDLLGHVARDAKVLAEAERLQAQEMADPAAVDANLAGSVVVLSAVRGNTAHLTTLVKTFQARKKAGASPDVQGRYLAALCAFHDPKAIRQVLAHTLDGTIPQEQLRTVLGSLLGHRVAGPLAWAFLRDNWAKIAPQVGAMGIARLVEATGSLPPKLRPELKRFFAAHPIPEAERAVRKSAEVMALWQGLRSRAAAPLGLWLRIREGDQPKARKAAPRAKRPSKKAPAARKKS